MRGSCAAWRLKGSRSWESHDLVLVLPYRQGTRDEVVRPVLGRGGDEVGTNWDEVGVPVVMRVGGDEVGRFPVRQDVLDEDCVPLPWGRARVPLADEAVDRLTDVLAFAFDVGFDLRAC